MDVRVVDDVGDFAVAAVSFLHRERYSANVIAVQVDERNAACVGAALVAAKI
jgi:hypothetical protein